MLDNTNTPDTGSDCSWPARAITVERVATANLPTKRGDFKIAGYKSLTSSEEFVVLYKGEMNGEVPTLVRIHSQCLTGDVFGSIKCDCGPQLHKTMEMIDAEGRGSEEPVSDNSTPRGRLANRRVEIKLYVPASAPK